MTTEIISLQFLKNKQNQFLSKKTIWLFDYQILEDHWTYDIKDALELSKGFMPLTHKRKALIKDVGIDCEFIIFEWQLDKRKKPKTEMSLTSEAVIEFSKGLYLSSHPLDLQNQLINIQLTPSINEALLISTDMQNILFNNFGELFSNSYYCYILLSINKSDQEPFNNIAYEQSKR